MIRFLTFYQLGVRHTCCGLDSENILTELDSEEIDEIQNEDAEGMKLLETVARI